MSSVKSAVNLWIATLCLQLIGCYGLRCYVCASSKVSVSNSAYRNTVEAAFPYDRHCHKGEDSADDSRCPNSHDDQCISLDFSVYARIAALDLDIEMDVIYRDCARLTSSRDHDTCSHDPSDFITAQDFADAFALLFGETTTTRLSGDGCTCSGDLCNGGTGVQVPILVLVLATACALIM